MKKLKRRILAVLLIGCANLFMFSTTALAADPVEVAIQGDNVAIRGSVHKNLSGEGFETKDQDCNYITFAIFDLSLMSPITDVTVMQLNNEQKRSDEVRFETELQVIPGCSIDTGNPERYVVLGTFEKTSVLKEQKSGSQFSSMITFGDFSVDASDEETIVQINRIGYITQNNAALKNGPNDELPAIGKDGLYLRLPKDSEVQVLYKGRYTYKIEYDGKQYYTAIDNIYFKTDNNTADNIADRIRKMVYEHSMLADFYAYGVSNFDFSIVEGENLCSIIEMTREQLMNGKESVYEAMKAVLKKEKDNGVSGGDTTEAFLDAVIEEDPLQIIGEAANDLYSQGRTAAIRQREEEIPTKDKEKNIQEYEKEHADDILQIEIDKDTVGRILGKIWDEHLSDDIINAQADEYGSDIAEKIYQDILGWDNRIPRNYERLIECYTGTPDGLMGFDVQGDINIGNDYANIKGSISQDEIIREYGDRLSEQMQKYIRDGKLQCLPFAYQTKNVSTYNRFLPGSLVVFEVIDSRVLSVTQKQYLGVYVGKGEFYLPGYSDAAFDTLCDKLDGIERTNGLIKVTQKGTGPFGKNASYGFLWLCHRNISIKNVYEADISLLNDPQYIAKDNSYFPMSAMRMSQIKYNEIEWQMENSWHPPKVWDE